jgi:hypothetical protein
VGTVVVYQTVSTDRGQLAPVVAIVDTEPCAVAVAAMEPVPVRELSQEEVKWGKLISDLHGRMATAREWSTALQQEKETLLLEVEAGRTEAQKRIAQIQEEIATAAVSIEEWQQTFEQAEGKLAAATQEALAAIERERRAECREIANRAVEAAREMDAHFAAAAKAAWLYQGYVMRLAQLDERVRAPIRSLMSPSTYTLAARASGLQEFLDLQGRFTGEKVVALATLAGQVLGRYVSQKGNGK